MKKILYWIIGTLLVITQAVVSAMCVVSIIKMNILENWVVWTIVGLLAVLFILCVVPLFIRKKKYVVLRIMCILVSIICIGGGIFAYRYTSAINNLFDKVSITVTEKSEYEDLGIDITKDPFIVYISGSDSHSGIDDPEARSDVNILAVINPTEEKMLLVSIPRDTYLQLHGTTGLRDKLTHAGYNNNVELSKATLEDFLGFEIDYTVRVSFDTVVEVVDELDGIDIYSDTAMYLGAESKTVPGKYCSYVVGVQHVDGDCALRFARERKSYARGDKHRGENQQEVLTATINKFLSSKDYLLRLPEILDIAANSFETSFTRDDITGFMRFQLNNNINWQIESVGLDGAGDMLPTYTYGEDMPLWVMIPDEESYQQIINKINEYLGNQGLDN